MSVILQLGQLKLKGLKFEASLNSLVKPYPNKELLCVLNVE